MKDPKKVAARMARFWLARCAALGVCVDVPSSVNALSSVNGVNGVNDKEKGEKEKEPSPHTPYKEKKEREEKAAAAAALNARACAREGGGGESVDGFMSADPTEWEHFSRSIPAERTFLNFCALEGIADLTAALKKYHQIVIDGWVDSKNKPITNWPKYFRAALNTPASEPPPEPPPAAPASAAAAPAATAAAPAATAAAPAATAAATPPKRPARNRWRGAYASLTGDTKTMFDAFWDAYPRRRRSEKDKCASIFALLLKDDPEGPVHAYNAIAEGLNAWASSWDWQKDHGQYVRKPYGFLLNEDWRNPPVGSKRPRQRGVSQTANVLSKEAEGLW